MQMKKKDYILLVICVSIALITLLLVNIGKVNINIGNNKETKKTTLLKDYSRFLTLESCVYRYVNYLQSKDIDSLLKVLDKEYVDKNLIDENNIFTYLDNLDGIYSFVAKKIYYEKMNDNLIKYYIYGQIIEDNINAYNSNVIDRYYIVYLDTNNRIFSISPYDGAIFSEVNNG